MLPRPQAEGSIFKPDPKPVNNLHIFIFFPSLKRLCFYSRHTHASVTVTVVRDRKIQTALRTNQIAEFVTVTAWKKIIKCILHSLISQPECLKDQTFSVMVMSSIRSSLFKFVPSFPRSFHMQHAFNMCSDNECLISFVTQL